MHKSKLDHLSWLHAVKISINFCTNLATNEEHCALGASPPPWPGSTCGVATKEWRSPLSVCEKDPPPKNHFASNLIFGWVVNWPNIPPTNTLNNQRGVKALKGKGSTTDRAPRWPTGQNAACAPLPLRSFPNTVQFQIWWVGWMVYLM